MSFDSSTFFHLARGLGLRFVRMELDQLAAALVALGCPPEKSSEMAAQLDKRARQLAEQKGRSYEEAIAHLISLMRQGWAAQSRGD
jgi:pyrroline-5-carboxylate reductase